MKKFLKKYWSHIFNLSFLIYFIIVFYIIKNMPDRANFTLVIGTFIYVVGIWVEMIYYIVHAAQQKEIPNNGLCAFFCYLFNIFYIPCYSLKYVSKDKNYKKKNIIYLILSILLYISIIVLVHTIIHTSPNMVRHNTYVSNDNVLKIEVPKNYQLKYSEKYDFYIESNYAFVIGIIYDGYNYTADEILEDQANYLTNEREGMSNMTLLESKDSSEDGKTIKLDIYSGRHFSENHKYYLCVITFDEKPNYAVYVLASTPYADKKDEIIKILNSVGLNK